MERDSLVRLLAQGESVEAIARRLGKHASTVAYWMQKYGLEAPRAQKHRAKGGIERERLEELVEAGMSVREIARDVQRSPATVRHWLREHGLRTARARRSDHEAATAPRIESVCPKHGRGEFVRRGSQGWRCVRCRSEQVADWRRRVKARLVAEAGGRCQLCGYDRCPAALEFHHLDPSLKRFTIGGRGLARSLLRLREEVRKCVLLCANCHAEVEAGAAAVEPLGG